MCRSFIIALMSCFLLQTAYSTEAPPQLSPTTLDALSFLREQKSKLEDSASEIKRLLWNYQLKSKFESELRYKYNEAASAVNNFNDAMIFAIENEQRPPSWKDTKNDARKKLDEYVKLAKSVVKKYVSPNVGWQEKLMTPAVHWILDWITKNNKKINQIWDAVVGTDKDKELRENLVNELNSLKVRNWEDVWVRS